MPAWLHLCFPCGLLNDKLPGSTLLVAGQSPQEPTDVIPAPSGLWSHGQELGDWSVCYQANWPSFVNSLFTMAWKHYEFRNLPAGTLCLSSLSLPWNSESSSQGQIWVSKWLEEVFFYYVFSYYLSQCLRFSPSGNPIIYKLDLSSRSTIFNAWFLYLSASNRWFEGVSWLDLSNY